MSQKRAAERQITAEDGEDGYEDEEETYGRASKETLATRRFVKGRLPSSSLANNQPSAKVSVNPFAGKDILTAPSSSSSSSAFPNESEYQRKMKKLNQAMLTWMGRQMVEHPLSSWKEGLEDYMKHVDNIIEKYGGTESGNSSSAATVVSSSSFGTSSAQPTASSSSMFSSSSSTFASSSSSSSSAAAAAAVAAAPTTIKTTTMPPAAAAFPSFGTGKLPTSIDVSAFKQAEPAKAPFPVFPLSSSSTSTFSGFAAPPSSSASTTTGSAQPVVAAPAPTAAVPAVSALFSFGANSSAATISFLGSDKEGASRTAETVSASAPAVQNPFLFSFTGNSGLVPPPPAASQTTGSFGGAFSFGGGIPASAASSTTTSFPIPPLSTAGGGGGGGGGGAAEDEDEGEPMLEPEKIEKNPDDKDEMVIRVTCKLYRFDLDETGNQEWKDMGKGSFSITRDPESKSQRILVRNTMGTVILNTNFFKTQKFEKKVDNKGKCSLDFTAIVAETEKIGEGPETRVVVKLRRFLAKIGPLDINNTLEKLQAAHAALP